MISISKMTADMTNGNILFTELDLGEVQKARVSRSATLDGGCVIVHSGVSDGDRTLEVKTTLTQAESSVLELIFRTEDFIVLSCAFGIFFGVIDQFKNIFGNIEFNFFVKERA